MDIRKHNALGQCITDFPTIDDKTNLQNDNVSFNKSSASSSLHYKLIWKKAEIIIHIFLNFFVMLVLPEKCLIGMDDLSFIKQEILNNLMLKFAFNRIDILSWLF